MPPRGRLFRWSSLKRVWERAGSPGTPAHRGRPEPDLGLSPALPVDIREIKEIRPGKTSRDFDRYQEDPAFRPDQSHCFVILYGMEFRLKTLSLQGGAEELEEVGGWGAQPSPRLSSLPPARSHV